ncbi:predicted protein [Streptomyces sp. C]|nr:predicted protein [Streptomyces sp. C]
MRNPRLCGYRARAPQEVRERSDRGNPEADRSGQGRGTPTARGRPAVPEAGRDHQSIEGRDRTRRKGRSTAGVPCRTDRDRLAGAATTGTDRRLSASIGWGCRHSVVPAPHSQPCIQETGKMAERKPIESWLTDMDGVLMHEGIPVPGADAFIKKLRDSGRPFLVLTNNSIYTARDLNARLSRIGLDIPVENIWTSALATAKFLDNQHPGGSAYVIGEAGLTTAMHEVGYVLTDTDPDFVILGETRTPKTYLALTCGLSPSVRGRPTGSYQSEKALPTYREGLLCVC